MKNLIIVAFLLIGIVVSAQKFDKGIVTGPMTTTEINAIVSPQEGRLIGNSTTKTIWYYDGTQWIDTGESTGSTYTAGTGLTLSATEFSVTNPFTDADETKLDGIEAGATGEQNLSQVLTEGNILNADIIPQTNDLYNLGSAAFIFNNMYAETYFYKDVDLDGNIFTTTELTGTYAGDFGIRAAGVVRGVVPDDGVISSPLHLITKDYADTNYSGTGTDDQTATEVPFTPNGSIAATNVQAAIQEVRDEESDNQILSLGGTGNKSLTIEDGNTIALPVLANADQFTPASQIRTTIPGTSGSYRLNDSSGRTWFDVTSNAISQSEGNGYIGENVTFREHSGTDDNEIDINFDFFSTTDKKIRLTTSDIQYGDPVNGFTSLLSGQEQIEDGVGSLFDNSTHTLAATVYDDGLNELTIDVEDDLALYTNTNSKFISSDPTVITNGVQVNEIVLAPQADIEALGGSADANTLYIPNDAVDYKYLYIPITSIGGDIEVGNVIGAEPTVIDITVTNVYALLKTAPTGSAATFDINIDDGTPSSMLSTKITIDASERSSLTAATQAVISTASVSAGSWFEVDIDTVGSTIAGATGTIVIQYTED